MGNKNKVPQQLPIFRAADRGDAEEVARIIKDIPSQIKAKNNDGWQPLHQAAFSGWLNVAKVLVEGGADVGAVCSDKDTPAHYAAAQGHCHVIRYLHSQGADLAAKDRDGETPLDVCGKRNADARKLITALLKGEDGGDIGREEDSDWETDESGEDDEE